jgi:N-acetylglucosamine kinase-like BadF-type ATPase
MTLVAGIDGGGSKTHVAVCTPDGSVAGFAGAGPSNWEVSGLAGAADTIAGALDKALEMAGAEADAVSACVAGLAGLDWPSDLERLESVLGGVLPGDRRRIVNDSLIALRAGATEPHGVVVVAGTGSVAAGRNRAGEEVRTLGLGRTFGDEGSASDMTDEALRAVARALVGKGPATTLSEALCDLAAAGTVAELLERASRGGDGDLDAAPVVLAHAEAGDPIARSIVDWAGRELGLGASSVAQRLGMAGTPYEVVLAGGLFRSRNALLEQRIAREVPGATLVRLRSAPVAGAVLSAIELLGEPVGHDARARLDEGLLGRLTTAR